MKKEGAEDPLAERERSERFHENPVPFLPLQGPFPPLGKDLLAIPFGRKRERSDTPIRVLKFHFGLGRVNIHINRRWGKDDEEDDHGKLVAGQDMAIGVQNSLINYPVLDKALVDIKTNGIRISF